MSAAKNEPGVVTSVSRADRGWWSARRAAVVALAAAVVVGGASIWFATGSTGPQSLHLFGKHGNLGVVPSGVGEVTYLDTTLSTSRAVYVEQIAPAVRANTASADVKILVCEKIPRSDVGGLGSGDEHDVRQFCSALHTPRKGERLLLGYGKKSEQLLYAITPHTAGRVAVAGVHFDYRQGNRHGREQCGIDIRVTAPAA